MEAVGWRKLLEPTIKQPFRWHWCIVLTARASFVLIQMVENFKATVFFFSETTTYIKSFKKENNIFISITIYLYTKTFFKETMRGAVICDNECSKNIPLVVD